MSLLYMSGGKIVKSAGKLAAGGPTTLPLLQPANVSFLGDIAIPNDTSSGYDFTFGGKGLSFYQDPTNGASIFMSGNPSNGGGYFGQLKITTSAPVGANPFSAAWNTLPLCSVLQNTTDITIGNINGVGTGNPQIYGVLPYGGTLIIAATVEYPGSQTVSHGINSNLSSLSLGAFSGWYASSCAANVRSCGGYMINIPSIWQTLFGNKAFMGKFGLSVISSESYGPTATTFDPSTIGASFPGTTLLWYPNATNAACYPNGGGSDCYDMGKPNNQIFNLSVAYGNGIMIPDGYRTILIVGSMGWGYYGYGTNTSTQARGCIFNSSTGAVSFGYFSELGNDAGVWQITNITKAVNAVVTISGYDQGGGLGSLSVGDTIGFQDVVGMTQINGGPNKVTITNITGTGPWNVTVNLDTTGYSSYSSGGSFAREYQFYDPQVNGKSPHAWPYLPTGWAYDANDFISVKNGSKTYEQIYPYNVFQFPSVDTTNGLDNNFLGACFDPSTKRIYTKQGSGSSPRLNVWQVQ